MADLSKEELWQIKRMNQRAKAMGGKVEVIWDKEGHIQDIFVAGRIEGREVYEVHKSLDNPEGKKELDALE